jgi:hypothetical protein
MRQNDLLEYVKAQPFRPFRIRVVSGTTFDIRHPELIRVGPSSCVIFFTEPDNLYAFDRFTMIGHPLIERIDHIDDPVGAQSKASNGQPPA